MFRLLRGIVALVVALAATGLGPVGAAGQTPEVAASGAWIELPASGDATAAAYLEVQNPTMYDVFFTSASAETAASVEFREIGADGARKSDALAFVRVPAYESFSFTPKGVHLLLKDVKRPLREGETIAVTLTSDAGLTLKVPAIVRRP